jgi:hypothetical protein
VVAEDSGQIYTDVNLDDTEWVEWDDKMKRCIGIFNIEHQFVPIK